MITLTDKLARAIIKADDLIFENIGHLDFDPDEDAAWLQLVSAAEKKTGLEAKSTVFSNQFKLV